MNNETKDPFKPEEIETAIRICRHYARLRREGERRALPLELHRATASLLVGSILEAIVVDNGCYGVVPRPAVDPVYGGGRLHIEGGYSNPGTAGMLADAEWMWSHFGVTGLVQLACPIAVYTWPPGDGHPDGTPRSEVGVFQLIGPRPENSDVNWFEYGTYPTADQLIADPFGKMHIRFLQEFHEWLKNPQRPCSDLNT